MPCTVHTPVLMALASASLLSTPRTVMYTFVRWASLQQMFDECFLWRFVLRAKWKIDEQLRPRSISSMRWSKRIWKRGPRLGEWQLLSPFVAHEKNIEDAVRRVADAVETIVRASVAAIRPFPSFEKSASPNKNLVRPPALELVGGRRAGAKKTSGFGQLLNVAVTQLISITAAQDS